MATIIDVAKKAGVSTATVSRAFNGSGMVSESARAAVMQAAKELGYVFTPRNHKDTPDKVIAVISPIQMPEIEQAIIGAALEENLSAVFLYSQGGADDELYLNGTLQLLEKQLKGVITISSPSLFYGLKLKVPAGMPLVTTLEDPTDDRTYFVGSDNIRIGYDATQYLIDRGCKRIASIAAVNDRNNALKMIQGYKLALLDNGITPDPSLCYQEDFVKRLSGEDPVPPLKAQIDPAAPPDGVFCVIDLMADDLYEALTQMGLRVPEDVKVISVGRTENYLRERFAQARINNDYEAIGREAVRKLCSLAERGEDSSSGFKTLVPHIIPE